MIFEHLTELRDPEPRCAALNMALDEVLLRRATVPLLRLYRWSRPSLSLGYFSKFSEAFELGAGRDLVRRWTGGGLVPHHAEELTYTLVVPCDCPLYERGAPEFYRLVHEKIATLLGSSGALAEAPSTKISDACFENPARHDVLLNGRKVAGAAQRRTRFGLLHQGSIQCGAVRAEALRATLGAALCANVSECPPLDEAELAEAETLAAERYSTAAWTRRF